MNFFEHQERARSRTALYVFLFIVAVVFTIITLYTLIVVFFQGSNFRLETWWNGEVFFYVSIITLTIILLGSLYKIVSLRDGAEAIARALEARPVDLYTTDLKERTLLNVVHEMAIASGCAMPSVYIMDNEEGINAMAAGFSVNDAAIIVTRGAVDKLSRRELQGVIGHEFSHILNGDMRLNVRLVGILFGIFSLIIIGRTLLRNLVYSRGRKSRDSFYLLFIGLALVIVGAVGYFFGRVIQAAISRQREYLADASAVQFTRDPLSIGGALLKIAIDEGGSRVEIPSSTEVSHMFFGPKDTLSKIFATHPPLIKRIERVCPDLLKYLGERKFPSERECNIISNKMASQALGFTDFGEMKPANFKNSIGGLDSKSIDRAVDISEKVPPIISDALRHNVDTVYVIYALLLDKREEIRKIQLDMLGNIGKYVVEYLPHIEPLDYTTRLAILEMATSKVKSLPRDIIEKIFSVLRQISMADSHLDFYEFAFLSILKQRLLSSHRHGRSPRTIEAYASDIASLLGIVAYAGNMGNLEKAKAAFEKSMKSLGIVPDEYLKMIRGIDGEYEEILLKSIIRLSNAPPYIKEEIIEGVERCVLHDKEITEEERLLLRFTSIILGIPVNLGFLFSEK